MCGIAGIIEKKGKVNPARLKRMLEVMEHRGPDQNDIFISPDEKIGIGAVRLKIIDLSDKASMPMKIGKTVIAMNGEIYNFKTLRNYLERKGEKFFSSSDTEVAGRLFIHEKEKSFDLFRGMFSIAVYDGERGDVLIVRDRLGIKPLYIYMDSERIVFASEVRGILASGLVKPELDIPGTTAFLMFGSAKYPDTPIRGIKEFPAGHYQWLLSGTPVKYWELPLNQTINHLSDEEIKENLRSLIEESVSLRLVSDVPLGTFLSGGLDSTIVTAIASKYKNGLNTYSIRFEEEEYDEGTYARNASEFIGTNHSEMVVTHTDVINKIDTIIKSMDMPTIDGVNSYFVSGFARENGMVVSLSGLGGDELFGGYSSFHYIPKLIKVKKSPIVKTGIKIIAFIKKERKYLRAAEFMNSPGSIEDAYFSIRGILTTRFVESLLGLERGFFNPSIYLARIINTNTMSDLNHIAALELISYMRDMLLRDTDCMSMVHSLEVRVPLIDHRVVEFVLKLPAKYRKNKTFLYETFKNYVPAWMQSRKKKGFIFPFEKWLKEDKINVMKTLKDSELFNREEVERIYNQFLQGSLGWQSVWALYVFEKWCEVNNVNIQKGGL